MKTPYLPKDVVSCTPDVSSVELCLPKVGFEREENAEFDFFLILACDGLWDVVSDQE